MSLTEIHPSNDIESKLIMRAAAFLFAIIAEF